MKKGTKLAVLIAAVAAVVSAVVLVIVFWDKLLAKCPCKKAQYEEELEEFEGEAVEEAEEAIVYTEEETADFADLGEPEAEVAEEPAAE
ncbi:MAG: hypothetical protein E7443_07135 [Ruminococcaceae bacterium]|nr:hypothetical protein [Oscillospiraceae bacterium]